MIFAPTQQGFGSDNHSGVHPEILAAVTQISSGHLPSYGTDEISSRTHKIFVQHFGEAAQEFYVFNGTAANVLALAALILPHHSVLCADSSHLNVDECGAPERFIGCKLITVPSPDGKITVPALEEKMIRLGDQHFSQPAVISITQPTEYGTVYSIAELKTLEEFARRHRLLIHMDGARLVNAAASLNVGLREISTDVGVDVLSLGGTKNGLMFGEAVVFLKPGLGQDFRFRRKQAMQLPSKTRFLAAQFEAFLGSDLWQRNARHANQMAERLAAGLRTIEGVEITQAVQANAVFAKLPKSWIRPLRERFFFYVWNEKTFECRLMTSFDTTPEVVDEFIRSVREQNGKTFSADQLR